LILSARVRPSAWSSSAGARVSKGAPSLRDLEGKITIVTGASSGIGAVAAQRLASEGAIIIAVKGKSPRHG
jgi:NADPH:quinone reductase-like Zn-dependent oxidoreductase